jgi:hypothetical protein
MMKWVELVAQRRRTAIYTAFNGKKHEVKRPLQDLSEN